MTALTLYCTKEVLFSNFPIKYYYSNKYYENKKSIIKSQKYLLFLALNSFTSFGQYHVTSGLVFFSTDRLTS